MTSIARHDIDEPPEGEPPFGFCPDCEYALVDEHECRCGWNEYEAIGEGAASARGGGVVAGIDPRPEVYPASPCNSARDDAMDQDHRRRGGEG